VISVFINQDFSDSRNLETAFPRNSDFLEEMNVLGVLERDFSNKPYFSSSI
jgi:hypothetical protein